jgi:hypothetical protein
MGCHLLISLQGTSGKNLLIAAVLQRAARGGVTVETKLLRVPNHLTAAEVVAEVVEKLDKPYLVNRTFLDLPLVEMVTE